MLEMALRQAVELGSYVRAADNFSELTKVSLSASSLHRLVQEYGPEVVKADEIEAEAMVCVSREEEGVSWRRIPEPDSEVMAVSADGVMVHLREEGWKEAKVASVSAAPVREAGEEAEGELRLTKHSYRAGLWDAKTFTNHYWAESYRRGVEMAKRIVCINDGMKSLSDHLRPNFGMHPSEIGCSAKWESGSDYRKAIEYFDRCTFHSHSVW